MEISKMFRMPDTTTDPRYKLLIETLKRRRESKGIPQRDLAKMLKQSSAYVGKVESFRRRLDVLEFVNYCKALKLDPKKVIEGLINP